MFYKGFIMPRVYVPLLKKGESLGYWKDAPGVCNGLTLKWIEACLLGQENVFDARMREILSSPNSSMEDRIKNIKEKIGRGGSASAEEKEHLRILGFYEGIKLYQSPEKHFDVFNKILNQDDFEEVSKIAGSDQILDQGGLTRIYSHDNLFPGKTREAVCLEIRNYLNDLVERLNNTDPAHPNVTFHLANEGHAMGLMYNTQTKMWRFKDPNGERQINTSDLNIDSIAEEIFDGFKMCYPSTLELNGLLDMIQSKAEKKPDQTFELDIRTPTDNGAKLKLRLEAGKWTYFLDFGSRDGPSQSQIYSTREEFFRQVYFLYNRGKISRPSLTFSTSIVTTELYKRNFDLPALEHYKDTYKRKPLSAVHDSDVREQARVAKNLLILAIHHNDLNLIKEITKQIDIRSIRLTDTKYTAHFAACYSRDTILKYLIDAGLTTLQVTDSSGQTPLHIAAKKGHLSSCIVLLRARPDLLVAPDSDGKTPVDYAVSSINKDELLNRFKGAAYIAFIKAILTQNVALAGELLGPKMEPLKLAYDQAIFNKATIDDFCKDAPKAVKEAIDRKLIESSLKKVSLRDIASVVGGVIEAMIPPSPTPEPALTVKSPVKKSRDNRESPYASLREKVQKMKAEDDKIAGTDDASKRPGSKSS
jgi:hypothetical protein